jgi:hypothetical protein
MEVKDMMTTDIVAADNGFHQIVMSIILSLVFHAIIIYFLMFHTYFPEPITTSAPIHVKIISGFGGSSPGPPRCNQGRQELKKANLQKTARNYPGCKACYAKGARKENTA